MILQVILSLLVISSLHQGINASLEEDPEEHDCLKKTGVDEELVDNYQGGVEDIPTDPKFKCYLTCRAENAGLIDHGVIQYGKIERMLGPNYKVGLRSTIRKCRIDEPTGTCEDYYNFYKCFHA